MFGLIPRRRRNQLRNQDEGFDSLVSDFLNDALDLADIGFKTDIKEDEENYYLDAELPGLSKEDINIEVQDGHLVISGNKEEKTETDNEEYLRREIRRGSFQRVFPLDNVKEDEITAEYDEGLLKVQLPKEEPGTEEDRKVIDIK